MEMERYRIFMNNILFFENSIGRGKIERATSYNRTGWYLSVKNII
jgi:hypothetical protein